MSVTPTQLRNFAALPPIAVISDEALQVYIDLADLIVSEDLAGSSYSVDRLSMIELNLAAHFAIKTYEHGGLTAQVVGQSEERYQLIVGAQGLATSQYGQTVNILDTDGILAELSAPPLRAQFRVV